MCRGQREHPGKPVAAAIAREARVGHQVEAATAECVISGVRVPPAIDQPAGAKRIHEAGIKPLALREPRSRGHGHGGAHIR